MYRTAFACAPPATALAGLSAGREGLCRAQSDPAGGGPFPPQALAAAAAVAAAAAGVGALSWASRGGRERDAVTVVRLRCPAAEPDKCGAVAAAFATRKADGSVTRLHKGGDNREGAGFAPVLGRVASVASRSADSSAGETGKSDGQTRGGPVSSTPASIAPAEAEAWMQAVEAAVESAGSRKKRGGGGGQRTVVACSSEAMAALPRSELARLAKMVETNLPGGELHGVNGAVEAKLCFAAAKHLVNRTGVAEEAPSAGLSGPSLGGAGGVAAVSGGQIHICDEDGGSTALMVCNFESGAKLVAKQGPEMGAEMYSWQMKKTVANALRRNASGSRLAGSFVLCGDWGGLENALALKSGRQPVWVGRASLLTRVDGEQAAVSQWLLLHASSGAASELEADCPELNSAVKVQAKRVKLARLVALKAILELGFHPKAQFLLSIAPAGANAPSPGEAFALGFYLDQRGH